MTTVPTSLGVDDIGNIDARKSNGRRLRTAL